MAINDTDPINKENFQRLLKIKDETGHSDKTWNEWLSSLMQKEQDDAKKTIEKIFEKAAYESYYDDWITNFALNLDQIWRGKSAKNLIKEIKDSKSFSGIVIGRGPSITKFKHLDLLANSNYSGKIICTDGALKGLLEQGVVPDKFPEFYVITIDTQESVKNFYDNPIVKKYGSSIKCILSSTVPQTTVNAISSAGMSIYWIHTLFDYNKGKTSFNYISGLMTKAKSIGLPGIQTGGNVGTSAWMIAWAILKCKTVGLIGIDLGYEEDTPWGEIDKYHKIPNDIDRSSELFKKAYPTIYNPDFNCKCKQDPKFQFYSNALKEFILKASKYVKTINSTEGGSVFGSGIDCMTFKNFLSRYQN